MKKVFAFILVLVMAASLLAGCGSTAGTSAPAAPAGDASAPAEEPAWQWERKVTLVCTWGVGSGAELSSAMVDGSVNICVTGVDDVHGLIDSGDIVPLISISEQRMSTLPDTECTGELGIGSCSGTWRGIFCRVGTPEGAVEAMSAALEEAWNSTEYQKFLKNACCLDRPGYANAEGFQTLIDEEYAAFEAYLKDTGLI